MKYDRTYKTGQQCFWQVLYFRLTPIFIALTWFVLGMNSGGRSLSIVDNMNVYMYYVCTQSVSVFGMIGWKTCQQFINTSPCNGWNNLKCQKYNTQSFQLFGCSGDDQLHISGGQVVRQWDIHPEKCVWNPWLFWKSTTVIHILFSLANILLLGDNT